MVPNFIWGSRMGLDVLVLKKEVLAPVSFKGPSPEYPVSSDWSAHTRPSQLCTPRLQSSQLHFYPECRHKCEGSEITSPFCKLKKPWVSKPILFHFVRVGLAQCTPLKTPDTRRLLELCVFFTLSPVFLFYTGEPYSIHHKLLSVSFCRPVHFWARSGNLFESR